MRHLGVCITLSFLALWFLPQLSQAESQQQVIRAEDQQAAPGSKQYFTGPVQITWLFEPVAHEHYTASKITFSPGARTYWHTHPSGQHLIITEGVGRIGDSEGNIVEVQQGGTVWCPPGVKHWHGATPDAPMTHITLTGMEDGKSVEWLEEVSDEQYRGK